MMNKNDGVTLMELLIVITLVGILAIFLMNVIKILPYYEKGRTANAKKSLLQIRNAALMYADEYGSFPPDVARGVPAGFDEFLNISTSVPGPFPGSVYDWDNWENQTCWDGSSGIIQVSLRDINGYKGNNDYVIYYVIQGEGIPHCSNPSAKGECLNCESRYP